MPKDDKNISLFSDLPSQLTEPLGFSPNQMVRCDECLRANPPNRIECLYCGRALSVNSTTFAPPAPSWRPPEKGAQAYNTILLKLPHDDLTDKAMDQVASLLRLEVDHLKQIFLARTPLPLARTATHADAIMIERSLGTLGLRTMIVSDQSLRVEAPSPSRLRTIELRESELVAYQTSGSEKTQIAWSAIMLAVSGRLFARQVQFKERKRRGSEKEILDASETSSDEALLDVYTKNQDGGWRIMANSFDFSCLGQRKRLLASENFSTLTAVIRDRAPDAEYDDSYSSVRRLLELVWPSEQQTASGGWHRDGAGKYSTSEVTMTSNELQFTRYSRLCHFLNATSMDQQ